MARRVRRGLAVGRWLKFAVVCGRARSPGVAFPPPFFLLFILHERGSRARKENQGSEREQTPRPEETDNGGLRNTDHPQVAEVQWSAAELTPGDVLYTPPGWWHHVETTSPSVSVLAPADPAPGEDLPYNVHL